jgi:hypothetical protein
MRENPDGFPSSRVRHGRRAASRDCVAGTPEEVMAGETPANPATLVGDS